MPKEGSKGEVPTVMFLVCKGSSDEISSNFTFYSDQLSLSSISFISSRQIVL